MSPTEIISFLGCEKSTVSRALNKNTKSELASVIRLLYKLETTVNERYFKDEKMRDIIKRFIERGKQKEVSFEHITFRIERHHDRLNYEETNNYQLLNVFETRRGLGEEIFLDDEFPKFCDVCSKYCEGEYELKKFLDEMHTMHMKIKEKGAGRHLIKNGRQKKGAAA